MLTNTIDSENNRCKGNRSKVGLAVRSDLGSDRHMDIAARVKELRTRLQLTQEGVAKAAGILRTDVVRVEKGHNQVGSDKMRRGLSEAFGVNRLDFGAYVDGEIDLEELLRRRAQGPRQVDAVRADGELEAAIAAGDWPMWLIDAARSRRNLHGTMSREQWAAWMRGLHTADLSTLAAVRPSAQEMDFERKRAAAKKGAKRR